MKKRILSIILMIAMALTFMPTATFAAAGEDFHYLVIGDSTTNGYGFDSYYNNGVDVRGFNQVVPEAYPALIKGMLEKEGKNVIMHQFAGSALRPDDLDAILNPDHVDDDYTSRVFTGHNRGENTNGEEWFKTWGKLIDNSVTDCATGEIALRNAFTSAIEEADLITYYLGQNSFGTFITSAIVGNRYGDSDTLQDLLAYNGITEDQINVQETREKILGLLAKQLNSESEDGLDLDTLDAQFGEYADLLVQGYVGVVLYFSKNIESIRELNPDCEVVVVGLHNYVDFIKADYNGEILDLGELYGNILEMANIYMASMCESADNFYYADLAEAEIPVFITELLDGNLSPTIQGYLDEMVGGIAKGVVTELSSYPDRQVGAMLRGWYEEGFTDKDYETLAALAEGMGLVDQEINATLSGFGLTVPQVLKMANLYYTRDDAFVPIMYDLMLSLPEEVLPTVSKNLLEAFFKNGNNYVSFDTLETNLELIKEAKLLPEEFDDLMNTMKGIGEQLNSYRSYGRVQEILLDCVSAEPFNMNDVLTSLDNGIDMDAIGAEVAAVILGAQEELSDSTKLLINLYFMFMFPDGMGIGAHPNEEGHQIMANVIYDAYKNKVVAKDYMDEKVLLKGEKIINEQVEEAGEVTVPSYSDIKLKDLDVTNYTALGDSTVFGYGLEDFEVDSEIFAETFGYKACSQYAYAARLAKLLGVEDKNFHQLSVGALRAEDILNILNNEKSGDEYFTGNILPMLTEYAGGIENTNKDYVDSIEASELITIGMGGNDFGTYLGGQLERLNAGEPLYELDWSKYSDNELTEIGMAIGELSAMIKLISPEADSDTITVVAQNIIYSYISFTENSVKVLDKIHEMNPDAKIVVLGLYNPIIDVYYQKEGSAANLEIGKVADIMLGNVNTVLAAYAEGHKDYCSFVNTEDTQVFADSNETVSRNIAADEYIPYINENHGLANHPDAVGHEYMFKQILLAMGCPKTGHLWNEGVETKAATCTEAGVRAFTCTICGETKTETITALDHNYGSWTELNDDQHQRVCTNDPTHIEKANHAWDSGKVIKAPTCTEDGEKTYTCSVCNATKTETISKLNHSFTAYTSNNDATCEEDGTKTAKCDHEGCTVTDTVTDEGSKLGHSYGDWERLNAIQHQKVCKNDPTHIEKANHTWDEGVENYEEMITTFTCRDCGATRVEGLTHTHEYVPIETIDPTCKEKGYTLYECVCGDNYKDDYTDELEHSWKDEKITRATLTKNGKVSSKCEICGEEGETNAVIYAVDTVKLSWTSTTYNGKTKKPAVTVTDTKGNKLTNGTDYTVTYADGRVDAGSYKVTVNGTGKYSFTKELTFKIKVAGIDTAKLSWTSTTYNGNTKKPAVIVVDKNGNTLVKDTDYTVTYASGRKKVGTYKVTVKGTGNYSFTKELTFKIKAAGIESAKLSYTSYTYTGKTKTPTVTVIDKNGNTLKKDTDYTVSYASGRKNVGTYKVTVKGKGNYSFTKTLTFKIKPPKATLSSVAKKSSTSVTVKWKKVENVTGYQIKYVESDDTTYTIKVKGASTVSKVLTNLMNDETYDVSIRTYKTVNGATYYSAYSTVKSVTL